jgi:hypothetical protein
MSIDNLRTCTVGHVLIGFVWVRHLMDALAFVMTASSAMQLLYNMADLHFHKQSVLPEPSTYAKTLKCCPVFQDEQHSFLES